MESLCSTEKFSYSTNIIFIFNEKLSIFNDYKEFSYLTNINIAGNLGLVWKLLFQKMVALNHGLKPASSKTTSLLYKTRSFTFYEKREYNSAHAQ